MATFYSKPRGGNCGRLLAAGLCFAAGIVFAEDAPSKIFAARAGAEFQRTQAQFQSAPDNPTNAWQFARACYDFADFATNDTQRATIAVQGIAAARHLIAREPKSAPGHYYLAMDLGQLARTELLGALKLVDEMEREFKTAADLDAQFDYAGPERNLGLLYRDAPGWPASIGSRRKARAFLEQAARRAPGYPENHLNLVESSLQWKEHSAALDELKALDALWPKAESNLTGAAWEQSWADWSVRRSTARKQLAGPAAPLKPPKDGR